MQDLINNLENIHSFEELDKVAESFHDSRCEIEKAIQKARSRIYAEQRDARIKKEQEFLSKLVSDLYGLYSLGHESCKMIVDRAWEDHHSYGTQEVTDAAYSLADFVEHIVKDEYQNKYWR